VTRKWIVLFDWDGTLIDSLPVKIQNAGNLFQQAFGVPADTIMAAYRRHSGIPRKQLFTAICKDSGIPALDDEQYSRLSKRFTELNLASLTHARTSDLLQPETAPALEALARLGYPLYVSSSADSQEIRSLARGLGLEHFFVDIMGSSPGFSKGAQHIQHVLKEQSALLDQLVFVGDEPTDIALGCSAGVLTIGKTGTYSAGSLREAGADGIIDRLSELPALLNEWDGASHGEL
jgi:phosphoglycolate phosphatase